MQLGSLRTSPPDREPVSALYNTVSVGGGSTDVDEERVDLFVHPLNRLVAICFDDLGGAGPRLCFFFCIIARAALLPDVL